SKDNTCIRTPIHPYLVYSSINGSKISPTHNAMASSMTQYPFISNILIKPTETTHRRRSLTLIKALKDSSSSDPQPPDSVKLALARAKAYKKSIQSNPSRKTVQDSDPVAKKPEFGQNKDGSVSIEEKNKGFEQMNEFEGKDKKDEPKVSAIDFVGLGFADKKEGRGLPAGLIPLSDPFPTGDLPDVEIIVGDTSRFGNERASNANATTEEETELYKPKVSTWGVFPRPNNISKTYGGGKTIRPGEVLETEESKAAKQARTRKMIAAYKKQMGLLIDPKLKAECEKVCLKLDGTVFTYNLSILLFGN
ncbi:hypothetical protein M8C21_014650, partial [Ambrosia artemisiifolia]